MKTIKAVSKMSGVSVRTLQYYDEIDLLKPSDYTEAGYRLYSEEDLQKLQQILLFKELEFPLKEIKLIMDKDFDKEDLVKKQIELLTLKKEYFESLIRLAEEILILGREHVDFTIFSSKKIER